MTPITTQTPMRTMKRLRKDKKDAKKAMDIACPVRDIACIKPTIENTDPAFAVGMQASCLVCDGTACGTVPMRRRRKRWLHKAAKRIPTLWIRKGFQSTLYTARRVFCFDD